MTEPKTAEVNLSPRALKAVEAIKEHLRAPSHIGEAAGMVAPAQSGWRTMEGAPRDGTKVLIYSGAFGGSTVIASWNDDRYANKPVPRWTARDRSYGARDLVTTEPTHWMPLPSAPGSPAEKGEREAVARKLYEASPIRVVHPEPARVLSWEEVKADWASDERVARAYREADAILPLYTHPASDQSDTERMRALVEALTPSGDTKAAYHGEFKFPVSVTHFDDEGEPEEATENVYVPWTTVKEIMAAILARAALAEKEADQ